MNKVFYIVILMTAIIVNATITPVTPEKGKDGYYSINTIEELYGFAQLVNEDRTDKDINARLEADITINEGLFDGVEMTDSTFPRPLCVQNGDSCAFEEWVPIGDKWKRYYGHFDGQGHTVRGVFINRPDLDSIGFFGVAGGMIENLNIADSYISGGKYAVGGILGAGRGYMFSCSFSGAVEGRKGVGGIGGARGGYTIDCRNEGFVKGLNAGGIVGSLIYVVDKCINTGTISGATVGGIVGQSNGRVNRSYNLGSVLGTSSVGGIVGGNDNPLRGDTLTNCLNLGSVKGENNVGAIIGLDGGYTVNSYALKGTAEELSDKTEPESVEFVDKESLTDGSLLKKLNSASKPFVTDWEQGESYPVLKDTKPKFKDGVYEIENEEQFMWFADYINECQPTMGYLDFALVNDLVFNKNVQSSECVQKDSVCDFVEWEPIYGHPYSDAPGFHGYFDGRFHTISGLYSSKSSGLFSYISLYGTVKNVILLDSYFTGNMPGSIANYNDGLVADCFSDAILRQDKSLSPWGNRGLVANQKRYYCESRFMNKDLWFDGKKLSPYTSKVCLSREEQLCEPLPEFDFTLKWKKAGVNILHSFDAYVAFPYDSKATGNEHLYPYRRLRYPAGTTMDSLGYLSFKYKTHQDTDFVRLGFWFRENDVGRTLTETGRIGAYGGGVDISEIEGICATYTSDHDIHLSVYYNTSRDSAGCSVVLPKTSKISTVQTSFKDYQNEYNGTTSSLKNCSSIFSSAASLWFEIRDSVAMEGYARIFEFGPKGTCKGNKKIAEEPEEYCYAGDADRSWNVCESNSSIPSQANSISSEMEVALIGKTLLFSGVSSNAVFRVVDLKGNVVKTGFALPMVDLSAVKTGVYAVVVRDGARKLVKKVPLW